MLTCTLALIEPLDRLSRCNHLDNVSGGRVRGRLTRTAEEECVGGGESGGGALVLRLPSQSASVSGETQGGRDGAWRGGVF